MLINIAKKCNISLDWLCGLSDAMNSKYEINEVSDLAQIMYKLLELNEIGIEIKVNDKLNNETESETNKWFTQLTVYGNDKEHRNNADLCNIISSVKELNLDIDSYEIVDETYHQKKDKNINYYKNNPLTKRIIPKLTKDERIRKRMELLK